jgi:hypothetical protein
VTVSTGTEQVQLVLTGEEGAQELDQNVRDLAKLPPGQGFHLTDVEGDSVVLSASIPDGTALTLARVQIVRAPPPIPPGAGAGAANGSAGDPAAGVGDPDAEGKDPPAVGEDGEPLDDAEKEKKKCCVIM